MWRKLHSEELREVHSVPSVITSIKSIMGWACGMNWTERNAYRTLVGKTDGDHIGKYVNRLEGNIKMGLKRNRMGHRGPDFYLSHEQGIVARCCECGNELLGCMKCGEFPHWPRIYQLQWRIRETATVIRHLNY